MVLSSQCWDPKRTKIFLALFFSFVRFWVRLFWYTDILDSQSYFNLQAFDRQVFFRISFSDKLGLKNRQHLP